MTVTTAEFIAALFEFTDDNFGVYFSSLPNDRDDPLEKTGERHTLTRDVAALEQFIAKWDRQRRGLFFCVSTMANTRNKANAHQITGAHSDIDFKGLDVGEDGGPGRRSPGCGISRPSLCGRATGCTCTGCSRSRC